MANITLNNVRVDGLNLFYRESGNIDAPVVLLLHGFPSSSFQYRNLIPLLSSKYRVLAPDLPGFGFTEVPESRKYEYTFENIATTVEAFLDSLTIRKFSVYIFDYGAPTALRIALHRPDAVQAIISQNGNAYEEGLESFWDPVRALWKSESQTDRDILRNAVLTFDTTKWQYINGAKSEVAPETYHLDWALISRPGNADIQLGLLENYKTNVSLYPQIQEYFRKSQVPLLAVWGKNDFIFPPAGAHAFKKDLPEAEIHLVDAGHFALETNLIEIADLILKFLGRVV
jgi:pimeloyl-ACP methyl ester carboxylesterase